MSHDPVLRLVAAGAQRPTDARAQVEHLLRLLHDLQAWVRELGPALLDAVERPWTPDAPAHNDALQLLHDELLDRYDALAAALATAPPHDDAWPMAHHALALRRELDETPLSWDRPLGRTLPWFAPTRRLELLLSGAAHGLRPVSGGT